MSTIKFLFTCLLPVFVLTLPAQNIKTIKVKRSTDTIVYFCLFENTYALKSVTQKGTKLPYNCYKECTFSVIGRYWDSTRVKRGDTLTRMNWYQLKNGQCINISHDIAEWKVRLNKQNNTLLMRKIKPLQKNTSDLKEPDHLLFKVIKCTCSGIILEDIPITSYHRRYYFSKKPNAVVPAGSSE